MCDRPRLMILSMGEARKVLNLPHNLVRRSMHTPQMFVLCIVCPLQVVK